MATTSDQPGQPEATDRRRLITSTIATLLILSVCLFVPAGTWAWARGWVFIAVVVAAGIVISLYVRRVNPDVIAARANRHEGTKPWDRWVLALFLVAMVAVYPVAALDDGRFHWSHVPWWACGIGYALLLAGMAGLTWAESVNKFFEPTVRIQTDRGHTVIDTGPYAIVRHPGYVAASLLCLGIPLALGSFWALIPAVISYLLLVVRTALEDQTLQAELPGYKEYAQRVRYRLVPGVW
jgi:protein-S-isoprenylcysteine O-methyltransferase Ste14